jgi:hypothetical protein
VVTTTWTLITARRVEEDCLARDRCSKLLDGADSPSTEGSRAPVEGSKLSNPNKNRNPC